MHPSLIILHSTRDDPNDGRRPAQIPQLDTQQASKESHNSIHNPRDCAWALRRRNTRISCDFVMRFLRPSVTSHRLNALDKGLRSDLALRACQSRVRSSRNCNGSDAGGLLHAQLDQVLVHFRLGSVVASKNYLYFSQFSWCNFRSTSSSSSRKYHWRLCILFAGGLPWTERQTRYLCIQLFKFWHHGVSIEASLLFLCILISKRLCKWRLKSIL